MNFTCQKKRNRKKNPNQILLYDHIFIKLNHFSYMPLSICLFPGSTQRVKEYESWGAGLSGQWVDVDWDGACWAPEVKAGTGRSTARALELVTGALSHLDAPEHVLCGLYSFVTAVYGYCPLTRPLSWEARDLVSNPHPAPHEPGNPG